MGSLVRWFAALPVPRSGVSSQWQRLFTAGEPRRTQTAGPGLPCPCPASSAGHWALRAVLCLGEAEPGYSLRGGGGGGGAGLKPLLRSPALQARPRPAHSPLDVGVIILQEAVFFLPVLKNVFNETAWEPQGDKSARAPESPFPHCPPLLS